MLLGGKKRDVNKEIYPFLNLLENLAFVPDLNYNNNNNSK